jgi:hypothetical protein
MNMKILSYILLLMTLMIVSMDVFACKGTVVLFQDSFAKLDPSWGAASDTQSVSNNVFVVKPQINMSHYAINQSAIYPNDMDYCVDLTLMQGDFAGAGAGPIFWAKDSNDYYFFYIVGDGTYYVSRYFNGRYLYPISTTKDPVINTASGAVNHLRVVTKGNQATFYINDKQVATFTGQPPEGGSVIGVQADSPAKSVDTWGFSNLKITKPQ